jgi:hypothetical protein
MEEGAVNEAGLHLVCAQCGCALDGETGSAVFFCRPCHTGYSRDGDTLRPHHLKYMDILQPYPAQAVYFGFWMISSQCTVAYPLHADEENWLQETAVPAFHSRGEAGADIGLCLLQRKLALKPGPAYNIPIFTCSRSWQTARAFPEVYLRALNPGYATRDVCLTLSHRRIALALVPFYQVAGGYIDSLLLRPVAAGELF